MGELLLKHQGFERLHRLAETQYCWTHFDHGQAFDQHPGRELRGLERVKGHCLHFKARGQDDFYEALPEIAVRSPKQKAPRGAAPEAPSRPAEQV
jgi:hypothetical protein